MKRPQNRQRESIATLDITPTIDVVFLLLIFFIATIRLPDPEANIRAFLPKAEKVSADASGDSDDAETENVNLITITLRSVGGRTELGLNGAVLKGGFRRLEASLRLLRSIADSTPDIETKVILDAAETVPYRYVVSALDVCAKHRFTSVSFAMPGKAAP